MLDVWRTLTIATFVLRPPRDAIQELTILTHSFDAHDGRNAGAVGNVVTRYSL